MALTKAQILAEVNSLLASGTNIEASEHRQTMYSIIDTAYDSNIDGVSLVGTDLIFTRDGGNGQSITIDLSSLDAGIPEAPEDGLTYGRKNATWHEVVATLPQSVERTYDPLVGLDFDVMEGAIYNAAAPSNSPAIAIDALTPAKRGCVVAFYNDGSVEPTITGAVPNPKAGTWVSGQVNVYWFMWDGHSFTQNIQTKAAVILPTLDDPTYTLASGAALELDYSFLTTDANATGGVFQIDTQADFLSGNVESVAGYSFGVDGTITTFGGSPLTAITYYTRLQSTASGYTSSGFTEESATAMATPNFSTLPVILATSGDTENVITLETAALPTPDSDTLEFRNVTLGGTFASVPTYSGMPYTHTSLTNDEEYEYKYTAIKAGYNSAQSTSSATPTSSIIIFEDTFDINGAPDSSKWDTIAVAGATQEVISNELVISKTAAYSGLAGLTSKFGYSSANDLLILQFNCDASNVTNQNNNAFKVGFSEFPFNINERSQFQIGAVTPRITWLTYTGGGIQNQEDTVQDFSLQRIKLIPSTGAVTFEYWTGSVWSVFAVTSTDTLDLGTTVGFFILSGTSTVTLNPAIFDNVYLSNNDYSTEFPI